MSTLLSIGMVILASFSNLEFFAPSPQPLSPDGGEGLNVAPLPKSHSPKSPFPR